MCGFTRCSSANVFHVLSTKWYSAMFSNLTKTHFLSVRCNQRKSLSVESRSSRSVSVRWESVTWESVTCDPPAETMWLHPRLKPTSVYRLILSMKSYAAPSIDGNSARGQSHGRCLSRGFHEELQPRHVVERLLNWEGANVDASMGKSYIWKQYLR